MNELVSFLVGKWQNTSFEVAPGKPIKREDYPETMIAKDAHTLTITAHGFKDGQDLTKDMSLKLEGDKITLQQGGFIATGVREGNAYSLKGTHQDLEFRFRLYTMKDRYVFHREIWKNGEVQQFDMSYLERI